MALKQGDLVHNKRTNMVGIIATIDHALDQARCEHDERTAFYSLEDLEPYAGACAAGVEYIAQAPAPAPAPPEDPE